MSEEINEVCIKTYDDWLKYYKNTTKEKVIEDLTRDVQYFADAVKDIKDLQQKVEQLEKENEYLKMSNPEQNMEHFRIVNENKRKIDMLRKENHQLENIRKETIEELSYMSTDAYVEDYDIREKHYNLLMNILNKGDNK